MTEQYARVDVQWSLVVQDIIDKGFTVYRISKLLGVAECTVRNWREGGEPKFGLGAALLKLHGDKVRNGSTLTVEAGEKTG